MEYSSNALDKLKLTRCKQCYKKPEYWSKEVYSTWLCYINGCNRQSLIKNTKFKSYTSPRYHFRNHPCYKKIAATRKLLFRHYKSYNNVIVKDAWLLGLFYADGSKTKNGKLSFGLSKHDGIIVTEVVKRLKKIFGDDLLVSIDIVGNMYSVRTHGLDICNKFPDKNDKRNFMRLWNGFTENGKLRFISGFIDGDGSCAFEDGINSIQLYTKCTPFATSIFYNFLKKIGYVSINRDYCLYISPIVGKIIKPLTMKKYIKKEYTGSVDINLAYDLLVKKQSIRTIAKNMGFDKKTISLALKRSYGKDTIQRYIDINRMNRFRKG